MNSTGFRIRDLEVQPATGLISGPGGEYRLEPRVIELLVELAQRSGALVTRAELLETLWPGGEVYDEALTQCVYQLRRQLLNAGGSEWYRNMVSTVPKRGYILNAEVEMPDGVASPAPRSAQSSSAARKVAVLLAIALVLVLVWTNAKRVGQIAQTPADTRPRSIAVLPFLPLVADQNDPVLEMGMADTLITRLSGDRDLVVRPMSSVRHYGAINRDSLSAGRELGVEAVVDGSIQRSGQALRVSVRLLRVDDGAALWAETLSAPFSDVFAIQDVICNHIAALLGEELGYAEKTVRARGGTNDTQAYEHYLKGRYHLARLTPTDLRLGIDYFREAVELDPHYAQAWLGLANAQFRIPLAGGAVPREYYPQAKEAAQRALEIDATLAEGYAMLGWIDHLFSWDWVAAEANFSRAIELDPNNAESRLGFASLLADLDKIEQAIDEVQRARELSPNYLAAAAIEGNLLLQAERFEDAARRIEEAMGPGETIWLLHVALARAYFAAGRSEEGLAEVRKAREISGESTWTMAIQADMLAQMGRREEAESLVFEMQRRAAEAYVPPYDLAVAYRALGDLDSSLRMLEKAYEVRDPKMAFLKVGGWEVLDDWPRFQQLLARMHFPDES